MRPRALDGGIPLDWGPRSSFLAGLRGQISGCRFDAWTLTQALERWGARGS